jgi:hypothetical protein
MGFTFAGALAVTGALWFSSSAIGQNRPANDQKGRVREAVLEAKASGRSEIEILAPKITPPGVDSLYVIGDRYSVIIAQPVKILTTLSSDGNLIETWYKLKVSELITKQPSVPQEPPLGQYAPLEILPVGAGEALLPSDAGEITIDGIRVIQRSAFGFRLQLNHSYVLCVYLESSGAIAQLAALTEGVFEIDSDGSSLLPMGRQDHPLVKDIHQRTGNSLEFLRKVLQEQRR